MKRTLFIFLLLVSLFYAKYIELGDVLVTYEITKYERFMLVKKSLTIKRLKMILLESL